MKKILKEDVVLEIGTIIEFKIKLNWENINRKTNLKLDLEKREFNFELKEEMNKAEIKKLLAKKILTGEVKTLSYESILKLVFKDANEIKQEIEKNKDIISEEIIDRLDQVIEFKKIYYF